ncbi:MAG: malto-oligosyltrehalose trehalohydrolase, partial [Chthoniobacterales bacterium]|nr:malto-oligosyltrehalose trehalohydrolase [Chthoniobacterales bacterium]
MTPAPTLESRRLHPQGAEILEGGVHYRTWCKHDHASVLILDERMEVRRTIRLRSERGDYFSGFDDQGGAGDLYRYCFDQERSWPDPASRFQPTGVHGSSLVVDPATFRWTDQTWVAPPCPELVLYELHIGTFTPEGTFRAAITKLDHLVRLGVNAIEIMPVGDFAGERNWGYDGVLLYAPARTYGNPDDLRALVDAAHGRGLGIILDVVYNHMGPEGNYLGVYHPEYFSPEHKTPWGAGLNFAQETVREFVAGNTIYWMRDFHIDGFRLDATHAILDSSEEHILAEISERVHEAGGFLIAEDDRNAPEVLRRVNEGGLGFNGVWSDDFHHVVRVALTSEREGYYEHFCGTPTELAETLQHGWLFRGQRIRRDGKLRGGESIQFDPERFVYCITNHDQVGNRAFGERLGQVIEPAAYRAASALLCLVP